MGPESMAAAEQSAACELLCSALTALLSIVRLLSNTVMQEVCRIKGPESRCFIVKKSSK